MYPINIKGVALRALIRAVRATVLPWREQVHVTRHQMYSDIRATMDRVNGANAAYENALAISGSTSLMRRTGLTARHVVEANYPEESMLSMSFDEGLFDLVVSDQVLEHVEGSPQEAIDEAYRVAKPGGITVHTTCFLNPIHYGPKDLWRFSEEALVLLCSRGGDILARGSWGNRWVPVVLALGLQHTPTPPPWHPLGRVARLNNPTWPFATWVVARKHGNNEVARGGRRQNGQED